MLVPIYFLVILQTLLSDGCKHEFNTENFEEVGRHFEDFIIKHGRTYKGEEKLMRFKAFADNLKVINRLNKNSRATYGVTKFADMSLEEKNLNDGYRSKLIDDSDKRGACKTLQGPETNDAPAAFDWRDKNAVSPVRDQSHCNADWAFSATGLIESRLLMQGKEVDLSEQQLLDCDLQSHACSGGLPTLALTSVLSVGGMESETDYPYTKFMDTCRFNMTKSIATIKGCHTHNITYEESLQELVYKEGPVAIGISATDSWIFYESGVLDDCDGYIINHHVLLVGYGSEDGVDFWALKDSRGEDIGDKGYFKIKRGVGCSGIVGMRSLTNIVTVEL